MKTAQRTFTHFFIVVALLAAGCSSMPVALGTRVTGQVPTGTNRVINAEACGFQLLLAFPILINSRMARAYRALEAQAGGDFITDVKVEEYWIWGFVGTSYCTKLQATAVHAAAQ